MFGRWIILVFILGRPYLGVQGTEASQPQDSFKQIFSELDTIKATITPQNYHSFEGIAGTYDLIKGSCSKKIDTRTLLSADHWPPDSIFKLAKDEELKKMKSEELVTISIKDSYHNKLTSTGGHYDAKLANLKEEELLLTWRKNFGREKNAFSTLMAKHFAAGDYGKAIDLQLEDYTTNLPKIIKAESMTTGVTLADSLKLEDLLLNKAMLNDIRVTPDASIEIFKRDVMSDHIPFENTLIDKNTNVKDLFHLFDITINEDSKLQDSFKNGELKLSDIIKMDIPPIDKTTRISDLFPPNVKISGKERLKVMELLKPEIQKNSIDPNSQFKLALSEETMTQPLREVLGPGVEEILKTQTAILDFNTKTLKDILKLSPNKNGEYIITGSAKKKPNFVDGILKPEYLDANHNNELNRIKPLETLVELFKPHLIIEENSIPISKKILKMVTENYAENGVKNILNPNKKLTDLLKPDYISGLKQFTGTDTLKDLLIADAMKGTLFKPEMTLEQVLPDFRSDITTSKNVRDLLTSQRSGSLLNGVLDYDVITSMEMVKYKNGLADGLEIQMNIFKEKIDASFKDQMISKYNLRETEITPNKKIRTLAELGKRLEKICTGNRRKRSVIGLKGVCGAGGCNVCKFRDKIKEQAKNSRISELENNKRLQSDQGENVVEAAKSVRNSLASGDFVNALSRDKFHGLDFSSIQVGKNTMITAIFTNLDSIKSNVKSTLNEIKLRIHDRFMKISGSKRLKTGSGIASKTFLFRNLAASIRNGDVNGILTTSGMLGLGLTANYLENFKKTKGFLSLSPKTIRRLGKVLSIGGTMVGIGFDVRSIIESSKCIKSKTTNTEICANEKEMALNETALLLILRDPKCLADHEICEGREAIGDIVASSLSIGLSVVGTVCIKCAPVTGALDLIVTIFNEMLQAGFKVAAFDKYIKLTVGEKVDEWFRNAFMMGFSQYLENIKRMKQESTNVVDSMIMFLINNPGITNVVMPHYNQFKCKKRSPCWDEPPVFMTFCAIFDVFADNQDYCDVVPKGPPSHTVVDLRVSSVLKKYGDHWRVRWTPNVRAGRLFCPPLSSEKESTTDRWDLSTESYCTGAYGIEYLKNRSTTGRVMLINYGLRSEEENRYSGRDVAYGATNSPNIFISGPINNHNYFEGGNLDDVFIFNSNGDVHSGSFIGGNGSDTLQILGGVATYIDERGIKTWGLGLESRIGLSSIEKYIGQENISEVLITSTCDLEYINLNGGLLGYSDLVSIRSSSCIYTNLVLEIHKFTTIENDGVGYFQYFIYDERNISIQLISSKNNTFHKFTLLTSYLNINKFSLANNSLYITTMMSTIEIRDIVEEMIIHTSKNTSTQEGVLLIALPAKIIITNTSIYFIITINQKELEGNYIFGGNTNIDTTFILNSGSKSINFISSPISKNTFLLHGIKRDGELNINILNGTGSDSLILIEPFIGHINSIGFNSIDFSMMKSNGILRLVGIGGEDFKYFGNRDFEPGEDFRKFRIMELEGELKLNGEFTNLIGRKREQEIVSTNCQHTFINLNGGDVGSYDLILLSSTNCTDPDERVLNIVIQDNTEVYVLGYNGGGNYNYDLRYENFIEAGGLTWTLNCLGSDFTLEGTCGQMNHHVALNVDISDISEFNILDTPGNSIEYATRNSENIDEQDAVKYSLKTVQIEIEDATFNFLIRPYLPAKLLNEYPILVGLINMEDRVEDAEEVLNAFFSFSFLDGTHVYINRLGIPTLFKDLSDCGIQINLIEDYKDITLQFQSTFVIKCAFDSSLIIIGGDSYVDFLEHVPSTGESHLVGNEGLETTFSILPSRSPVWIYPSSSAETRNILDLTSFYNQSHVVNETDYPTIETVDENNLLINLPDETMVIIHKGIHIPVRGESFSVVLRYSHLLINWDEEIGWSLGHFPNLFQPEKQVVVMSTNDIDGNLRLKFSINQTTNTVLKLDNDSIMVTNGYEADNSEQFALILTDLYTIHEEDGRESILESREIILEFPNLLEPIVLDAESFNNLQTVEMAWFLYFAHKYWIYLSLPIFFIVLTIPYWRSIVGFIKYSKERKVHYNTDATCNFSECGNDADSVASSDIVTFYEENYCDSICDGTSIFEDEDVNIEMERESSYHENINSIWDGISTLNDSTI